MFGPLGPISVYCLLMGFLRPFIDQRLFTTSDRKGRHQENIVREECEKKKETRRFSLSTEDGAAVDDPDVAEAAVAILLTIPSPKILKNNFVSLVSLILQPTFSVVPFAGFQLLDIYWKNEHRLMCTSDICTAAERDRYEKSIYKAQKNVILCASACLLYWCIYRICKYYKEIQKLEEIEKKYKEQ